MTWTRLGRVGAILCGVTLSPSQHAAPRLLSFLQVGRSRIGFANDTLRDGGASVVVTQNTISDTRQLLGASRPVTTGDASTFLRSVCYFATGNSHMVLVLESEEMGNGTWLTGFSLLPAGRRPGRERHCGRLRVSSDSISTSSGLRLGLTRAQLEARLGMKGRDSANVVVYERAVDKPFRRPDGASETYTESSWLYVHFRRGKVAGFLGGRIDAS
ncbi:MAG: hypothetical protein JWO05_774 [Gemmatimonadetes bacterium]|nr:hypothetical protein [Gemmatimonadota bacterium]